MRQQPRFRNTGFTLIELLMTMIIGSVLILGVSNVMSRTLQARDVAHSQNELTRQARFAMQQIVQAVTQTGLVQVPLSDSPLTPIKENIREQSFPASPPPVGSSFASAVLAVTLSPLADLDGDGVADADNDGDGRIDEDLPSDSNNDGKPGIAGIDDDGNGKTDLAISPIGDDDETESFSQDEDALNATDDDGDGNSDEDPGADNNNDSCPGICLVDDNGDGSIDNGLANDDDEDGQSNEDWYDTVVFYLSAGNLIQRTPVPWDTNASGQVTGADYIGEIIATHVSKFRIERIAQNNNRAEVIAITLQLSSPGDGTQVSLSTQVRVGSRL